MTGITWHKTEKLSKSSGWEPAEDDYAKETTTMMDMQKPNTLQDFARTVREVHKRTARKRNNEDEEALRVIRKELRQADTKHE